MTRQRDLGKKQWPQRPGTTRHDTHAAQLRAHSSPPCSHRAQRVGSLGARPQRSAVQKKSPQTASHAFECHCGAQRPMARWSTSNGGVLTRRASTRQGHAARHKKKRTLGVQRWQLSQRMGWTRPRFFLARPWLRRLTCTRERLGQRDGRTDEHGHSRS